MIHSTDDFYNKTASTIKAKYFPNVVHGQVENKNYIDANYAIELFNNGCLTYRKLISRLAKACGDTTFNINTIVEKFIISFGEYKYQPKKITNHAK